MIERDALKNTFSSFIVGHFYLNALLLGFNYGVSEEPYENND